jgi:hypothetical protein
MPPVKDGALRRSRRVQRRNMKYDSDLLERSFSPLDAGWDGAARPSPPGCEECAGTEQRAQLGCRP